MPDISMCENEDCPLKYSCYRYMAEPSEWWQSYADFKPDEKGECKDHLPVIIDPTK
jgi:hypothetical protein